MTESPPLTSVDAALANAMRLLGEAPELAAEQARQILVAVPGEPGARLVLGMAHNAVARHAEAGRTCAAGTRAGECGARAALTCGYQPYTVIAQPRTFGIRLSQEF